MRLKSCIIYGCMKTKEVMEFEHSGRFYCQRHYPKVEQSSKNGSALQKQTRDTMDELKKITKKAS